MRLERGPGSSGTCRPAPCSPMAFMREHLVLSSDEDKSSLDTRDSLEKLLVTGSVMLGKSGWY